jgi:hypothetical protein
VNNNEKGCGRKCSQINVRDYPRIYVERLRKNIKKCKFG